MRSLLVLLCITTRCLGKHVILFQRIIQSGGTSIVELLKVLQNRNDFILAAVDEKLSNTAHLSMLNGKPQLATRLVDDGKSCDATNRTGGLSHRRVAEAVDAHLRGAVDGLGHDAILLHGHFNYDAWIEHPADAGLRVDRVAVLREPVARVISNYNFMRRGCLGAGAAIPCTALAKRSRAKLSACFDDVACRGWLASLCRHQTEAVCGHDAIACLVGDDVARAAWLSARYAHLGTTERVYETVVAWEAALPRFFAGAAALYDNLTLFDGKSEWRYNVAPPSDDAERYEDLPARAQSWLEGACAAESALYEATKRAFPTVRT